MKKFVFTKHALERGLERCGKNQHKLRDLLKQSVEFELPPGIWASKFKKYGAELGSMKFLYHKKSFTNFNVVEKKTCLLIVTVFRKKINNIKELTE